MKQIDEFPLMYSRDNAQSLRLDPFPHYVASHLYLPIFNAVVELRLKAIEANWATIFEHGYRCQGLASGTLRLLKDQLATAQRQEEIRQRGIVFSQALYSDSLGPEDQEQIIADLLRKADTIEPTDSIAGALEQLKQNPVFTTVPMENIEPLIEEYKQMHLDALNKTKSAIQSASAKLGDFSFVDLANRQRNISDNQIAAGGAMIVAGLSRGLTAVAHAAYNLTKNFDSSINSLLSHDHLRAVKQRIELFEYELKQHQLNLYTACLQENVREIRQVSINAVENIESSLPAFMRFQAVLRQATERLLTDGRNGDAEQLGYQNMLAGTLTREALGSHAAALRLQLEVGSDFPSKDVTDLIKRASQLGFNGSIPDGKNTELKDLATTEDGTFVEVKGFVNDVEVFETQDKPRISRVELLDPSNGAVYSAVIPFSHFPHMGLTQGAFCRLNGELQSSSQLNRNAPAIEIDRLSLASLAKQSWRFAFIRIAEPWYEVWRSKVNMSWSIGPHRAQDDQQNVSEGAADLVYPPLIRD